MSKVALELVRFQIDPATEDQMLAARSTAMAAIRAEAPGLLESRLFRGGGDGEWIDVLFWTDLDSAEAASEIATKLPETTAYFGLIIAPPEMLHGVLAVEGFDG